MSWTVFPMSLVPFEVEGSSLNGPSLLKAPPVAPLNGFISIIDNVEAQKLLLDVHAYLRTSCRDGRVDVFSLAARLMPDWPEVNVREGCRAAHAAPTSCFKELRHTFVCVRAPSDAVYIVDPRFRESFLIPHPTSTYSSLLAQVDDVFVGTPAQLKALVTLLAKHMAASFLATGLTLPPWRQCSALLSKWLPHRSRNLDPTQADAPPPSPTADRAATTFAPGAAQAGSPRSDCGGSPRGRLDFHRLDDRALLAEMRTRSASGLLSGRLGGRRRSLSDAAAVAAAARAQSTCVTPACHASLPPTYRVRLSGC